MDIITCFKFGDDIINQSAENEIFLKDFVASEKEIHLIKEEISKI